MECKHEFVYVGIESMRKRTPRNTWETDVRGKIAYFEYRVLYCKFCGRFIKTMHKDQYGNNPLEDAEEY